MGLPVLLLAQALVSLAPTVENVHALPSTLGTARFESILASPDRLRAPVPAGPRTVVADTGRPQAVSLSDGYYTRLDIHRYASYATLPLFVLEYVAGQKLLTQGSAAPLWAEKVHKPAAYAVAAIFTVNTVTGLWNLAEADKVKQGRKRRWWHAALMIAADAGFIYGVSKAPSTAKVDARIAAGTRGGWTTHKIATVASMSVATVGYLMMYVWKEK
jgi:hypothetical protein